MIDKNKVKNNFTKSINSYNNNAIIQKEMATFLVDQLLEVDALVNKEKILEIGCGTGLLTKNILNNNNDIKIYDVNDIVPEFENVIHNIFYERSLEKKTDIKYNFLLGDIEEVLRSEQALLNRRKYSLAISNATFQWLADKKSFFRNIFNSLNKDGILCFSSFGKDNLKEIIEIFNPEDGLPLNYFMLDEYENILQSSGFEILYKKIEEKKLYFDNPISVLRHFRDTGVNAVSGFSEGNKTFSKKDLEFFIKEYSEKFTDSITGQIYLTYNPIYIIAKKVR